MSFPIDRPRRLRRSAALRRMVRETRLRPEDLVYPAFVREGIGEPLAIPSLAGHHQETEDSLVVAAGDAVRSGCSAVSLFGIPEAKNGEGSMAWDENGVVQRAT